jgi:hypothetical protein
MSPQVAAKNKWARIEARLRNRCFVEKYRDAFLAHLAGLANVVFPFGTYLIALAYACLFIDRRGL